MNEPDEPIAIEILPQPKAFDPGKIEEFTLADLKSSDVFSIMDWIEKCISESGAR